jgi:hypothetical protein
MNNNAQNVYEKTSMSADARSVMRAIFIKNSSRIKIWSNCAKIWYVMFLDKDRYPVFFFFGHEVDNKLVV